MTPGPDLTGSQCALQIRLADGTVLDGFCAHPRGAPERPLTAAQVEAKFRRYAPGRLTPSQIDRVIAAVAGLETVPSVRDLMGLLRRTG